MMRFFRFCGAKANVAKDTQEVKDTKQVEEASTVGSANEGPNEECLVGCPVKTSYGSGEICLVKQYEGMSLAEVKLATGGTVTLPSSAALASASVVGETVGTPSGRGTVRGLKIYEGVLLAVVGLASGGESTLPVGSVTVIEKEDPVVQPQEQAAPVTDKGEPVTKPQQDGDKDAEEGEPADPPAPQPRQEDPADKESPAGGWLPGAWCSSPTTTEDDVVVGA
mmetsp:Transcript_96188/g.257125  ORF Transcript_96188/g.257125 Transcript_96188/m.257125 type:complete len:223 (-) Transcript_96188:154-822(-)